MIEMTLFFKCLHVQQLSNTMNGLRPYLKAVNLLKQWGSRNRILRCTSAGQCACQHACLSAFAHEVTEKKKVLWYRLMVVSCWGFFGHFLIYSVRLKRCSFRQMKSRAALRSALWWSHEGLLRQRQGHTKYSVFTAQLSAYHFLFTCLLRARSLFFSSLINTQTTRTTWLNLT